MCAGGERAVRRRHLQDLLRARIPRLREESTGKNPAANLKALLGVCSLWAMALLCCLVM